MIIMQVYEENSKESSILCDVTSSNTIQKNNFVTLHKRLCKSSNIFQKCKKEPEVELLKKITYNKQFKTEE